MMAAGSNVQVVVNPVSGGAGSEAVLDGLCRRMRDAGWRVSVHETRGLGDAREVARRSCHEGVRALVVAGGDGTVSEAAAGMVGPGVPMLVVPCGTENILAKYFGARLDADWLWHVLRKGREIALDLPTMNGRRFLLAAGMGFDAEIVRRLARHRRGHITYWSYFWPIWRTFWGYSYPKLSVEVDGRHLYTGPALVYVGNVPRYAVGLRILDRALPDDGLLDVCIFECRWQGALLWHALNKFLGRHQQGRGVIYQQARRVRVWAEEPVPIQVDGDVAGWLPAEFDVTHDRARFLVAAQWRG